MSVKMPADQKTTVEAEEVIALKTIVMVLAGTLASEHEIHGLGSAESWINSFAASCREAVSRAAFPGRDAKEIERIRRHILNSINLTFSSIDFEEDL